MKKLNNLNYIVVTPDRRKQTRLCHENMLKPLVESSSNLVKELANVNLVVSEPKELSGELSSSHLRPTDTTKLTNYNVLQNLNSKLSYLKESQRQDLNKPLQECKELFADVPSKTDQMYHDVDVSDAATVNQHPYRLHPNKQQYLKYVMKFDLSKRILASSIDGTRQRDFSLFNTRRIVPIQSHAFSTRNSPSTF